MAGAATIYFHTWLVVFVLGIVCIAPNRALAQEKEALTVATYVCPPFVIAEEDGGFSGLSIFLWEEVAKALELEFDYKVVPFENVLSDVGSGQFDVGISCVTITSEREAFVDFSHSFYEVQLGIATHRQDLLAAAKTLLFDKRIGLFLLGLLVLAIGVGAVFYFFEHKINNKLYAMKSRRGQIVEALLMGILFTTKGPFNYYEFKTLPGRVLNVFLAVFSTFAVAAVTAMLASTFTLGLMSSEIKGPRDLAKVRVGAIEDTTAADYLDRNRIPFRRYEDTEPLLAALGAGEVDAIVDDAPLLGYFLKKHQEAGEYQSALLLPFLFEIQNYGFVLKEKSRLRENINRELLKTRQTPAWRRLVRTYFGEE